MLNIFKKIRTNKINHFIEKIEINRGRQIILLTNDDYLCSLNKRFFNIDHNWLPEIKENFLDPSHNKELDIILHLDGCLITSSDNYKRLADTIKTNVYIPNRALCGGTLISLYSHKIFIKKETIIGGVNFKYLYVNGCLPSLLMVKFMKIYKIVNRSNYDVFVKDIERGNKVLNNNKSFLKKKYGDCLFSNNSPLNLNLNSFNNVFYAERLEEFGLKTLNIDNDMLALCKMLRLDKRSVIGIKISELFTWLDYYYIALKFLFIDIKQT